MIQAYAVADVRAVEAAAMASLPEGELMGRAAKGLADVVLDRLALGHAGAAVDACGRRGHAPRGGRGPDRDVGDRQLDPRAAGAAHGRGGCQVGCGVDRDLLGGRPDRGRIEGHVDVADVLRHQRPRALGARRDGERAAGGDGGEGEAADRPGAGVGEDHGGHAGPAVDQDGRRHRPVRRHAPAERRGARRVEGRVHRRVDDGSIGRRRVDRGGVDGPRALVVDATPGRQHRRETSNQDNGTAHLRTPR